MAIVDRLDQQEGLKITSSSFGIGGKLWGIVDYTAKQVFTASSYASLDNTTMNIQVFNNQLCFISGYWNVNLPNETGGKYIYTGNSDGDMCTDIDSYINSSWCRGTTSTNMGGILIVVDSTGIKTYVGDDIKGKSTGISGYLIFRVRTK